MKENWQKGSLAEIGECASLARKKTEIQVLHDPLYAKYSLIGKALGFQPRDAVRDRYFAQKRVHD